MLRKDARLFLQIQNSIGDQVVVSSHHERFDSLYSTKGMLPTYMMLARLSIGLRIPIGLLQNTWCDSQGQEHNELRPFNLDIKEQWKRERVAVMSSFAGLPLEFDSSISQVLTSPEISSLQNPFARILPTKNTATSTKQVLIS